MRYVKRICKRISDKLERLMKENLRKAICGRFGALRRGTRAHGDRLCSDLWGGHIKLCGSFTAQKREKGRSWRWLARGTHDLNKKTVSQNFSISNQGLFISSQCKNTQLKTLKTYPYRHVGTHLDLSDKHTKTTY